MPHLDFVEKMILKLQREDPDSIVLKIYRNIREDTLNDRP